MQMQLTLSTFKPISATYTDTESGVDKYRVHTEISVIHGTTTTISRRIDRDIPRRDGEEETAAGAERLGQLAHIAWRVVGSTVVHFGGREIEAKDFFRKGSRGLFGCFHGQDGQEYKWNPQVFTTTLTLKDTSATLVAEYHAKDLQKLSKGRAWLEISPPSEHMADEIVVTLAYMGKIRNS
ncbi:hypothetical protein C8R46DRAFT_1234664 [Mycena filopes]|nr:hypothetical protein C8R46DRAFT_1234664 [Mycena filopes]